MRQCVGYGKYKGICPNCASGNGNILFCSRCYELRNEEKKIKDKKQKEAQEKTEKIIEGRE